LHLVYPGLPKEELLVLINGKEKDRRQHSLLIIR